ncbi:MAG: histidine kinase [Bacteroidales bacterium]|jgi:sensor histidine kinase YesM|nr:histidine kinase [Bacteroidales bacterium]
MKHPVLENRVRLTVWGIIWLVIAAGQTISFYYAYGQFLNVSIIDAFVSIILYSGLALSLWFPFNYFSSGKKRIYSVVLNLAATGAITILIWILLSNLLLHQVLAGENDYQAYWDATLPYRIGSGIFIYSLTILSYFLFVSLNNLSEKKSREARLETLVKETELRMLRSQINPHFLFNSLNSISSLTVTNPDKAREMVIKLSDFMRYALARKDEQPVSLRSELENLRLYLDIEKVRFGDRLVIEEQIDPSCLEVKIPGMLLQPLYENAVKHGVYESTEQVKVCTTATVSDGMLSIVICNNFDPEAAPRKGTGTGIMNVSRRLELSYGNKATLTSEKKGNVFTVALYMPA